MIGPLLFGALIMLVGVIVGAAINDRDKRNDHVGDGTTYDQNTLTKVYRALDDSGIANDRATDVVTSLQNAGILFRERKN